MDKTDNLPSSNASYANVEYWNQRFEDEEQYDWLLSYSNICDYIANCVKKSDRILMLGCGNSSLSEKMFQDGYLNITNIDYSSVVIDKMSSHCSHCSQMNWLSMDARDLCFPNCSFDVVMEKATVDSFLVKETDPWKVSQDTKTYLQRILSEVSRVLKENGCFVSISFSQPHFRGPLYADPRYNWSFSKEEIGTDFHYYIYLMVKGQQLKQDDIFIYKPPKIDVVTNCSQNENDVAEHFLASIEDIF